MWLILPRLSSSPVVFGCRLWLSSLAVVFGCRLWLSSLAVVFGCCVLEFRGIEANKVGAIASRFRSPRPDRADSESPVARCRPLSPAVAYPPHHSGIQP
jgi:hypothetical protein